MSKHQRPLAWWEQPPKDVIAPGLERERERLRAELARAWGARVDDTARQRTAASPGAIRRAA